MSNPNELLQAANYAWRTEGDKARALALSNEIILHHPESQEATLAKNLVSLIGSGEPDSPEEENPADAVASVIDDPRESDLDVDSPSIGFFFVLVVVIVVFFVGFLYATDEIGGQTLEIIVRYAVIGGVAFGLLVGAITIYEKIASKSKEVAKRVIENQPVQKIKGASKAAAKAISGATTSEVAKQQVNATKYDNLLKLKTLLDQNVISQEEFEEEKRKILGGQE